MFGVLIAFVGIGILLYSHFVANPRQLRAHYEKYPKYLLKWQYNGGINQDRKLRIVTGLNKKIELKIGFSQFGGYMFYGSFWTDYSGVAVIETWLGEGGCDFIVAAGVSIAAGNIQLLDVNDNSPIVAAYKKHFWQ